MTYILKSIEYKGIFRYFEEVSNIPRGSNNNKGISDYLVQFAKDHQLEYTQDEYLNVIMIKEATKGYENAPTVILQGHMDMVCEKNNGIDHDFMTEGLKLKIKDDFIYAKGTTLGGDDGVALAYALAILDSNEIPHPRLEVIITTDEETGMDGAKGLDLSKLEGKYLFNIDQEEEGILLCSSAGGLTGTTKLQMQHVSKQGKCKSIEISGLFGGHSGTEINKNRTNANILMARLLFELRQNTEIGLVNFIGGLKDNAIPRESVAKIVINESEEDKFNSCIQSMINELKKELTTSEPHIEITVKELEDTKCDVLDENSIDKLLFMLLNAPNGVQVMSYDMKDLVESSVNLGILKVENGEAEICFSVRSSKNSYKHFISNKLKFLSEYLGGEYRIRGEYPAWEYRKESPLRDLLVNLYKEEYGYEPKLQAIHAGLECGIIAEKIPDIDIVSIGPDILDIHTPLERLCISSTKRVFDYLVKALERMKDIRP